MPWIWLGGQPGAFLASSGGSSVSHRQSTSNSCWASSGRHIWNFLNHGSANTFASDVEYASTLPASAGYSADRIASAPAALGDRGCEILADENAIPTLQEIATEIAAGTPLLVNIGRHKRTRTKANLMATGGHWVVIVGVNPLTSANRLGRPRRRLLRVQPAAVQLAATICEKESSPSSHRAVARRRRCYLLRSAGPALLGH
jgi:hypothetical protein